MRIFYPKFETVILYVNTMVQLYQILAQYHGQLKQNLQQYQTELNISSLIKLIFQNNLSIFIKFHSINSNSMSMINSINNNFLNFIVDALVQNYKNRTREKYRFPSTISAAKVHINAAKFGFKPRVIQKDQDIRCACCNLIIGTEKIGLCYPTTSIPEKNQMQQHFKENQFLLSSSVSMFFYFIKMIIIYLVIKFLMTDLYNLVTSIVYGSFCKSNRSQCHMSIWTITSGLNKKQNAQIELQVLDILNFLFIIFSIIFFILFRQINYKHFSHIDQHVQSEDDYAIFVEEIPVINQKQHSKNLLLSSKIDFQLEIQQFFKGIIQEWLQDYDVFPYLGRLQKQFHMLTSKKGRSPQIIKSISLCYDLSELRRIIKLRKKIMKYHEQIMYGANELIQCLQIEALNDAQLQLSKRFSQSRDFVFNLTHFVNCAIVCFEYQHYRDYILQKIKEKPLIFKGNLIYISQCPNPRDIKWYNLSITQQIRSFRVKVSLFFMFLCLVFSFILVGFIEVQKYKFNQYFQIDESQAGKFSFTNYKGITIYCLTFLANCITLAINYGLYYFLIELTRQERHKTMTWQYSYLIVKLLISQFLNYAIIYPLIYIFLPYDSLGELGLVFTVSTLIAFSGIVQIILNLINLPDCYRRFIMIWKYRKARDNDPLPYFQLNLNKQLEYIQFDFVSRYTYYILQIFTIMMYSYAIPLSSFISIIILFLQYWIDKLNLFKRSSLKFNFGLFITKFLLTTFEYSILIFSLGNLYFSYYAKGQYTILNFIGIGISILYLLIFQLGWTSWQQKIIQSYQNWSEYTYSECVKQGKFRYTFWLSNPATQLVQQEALTGHKNSLKESMRHSYIFNCHPPPDDMKKPIENILMEEL